MKGDLINSCDDFFLYFCFLEQNVVYSNLLSSFIPLSSIFSSIPLSLSIIPLIFLIYLFTYLLVICVVC